MDGTGVATIRILLADDHPLVREGLRTLISGQSDLQVVGEAADGDSAYTAARELEPDVIVLDLSMPGPSGPETAARFVRDLPNTKILVLTVHEEDIYLTKMLRIGVHGYVLKRSVSTTLIDAIRNIAASRQYIDPALAGRLVEAFLSTRAGGKRSDGDVLSPRESDVVVRVAQGFSNKEIAADLGVGVKTVETYKARILEKLGLRSRAEIVRYAAANKLLDAFYQ